MWTGDRQAWEKERKKHWESVEHTKIERPSNIIAIRNPLFLASHSRDTFLSLFFFSRISLSFLRQTFDSNDSIKKMVKIDNKEIYSKMDPRKLDKIQIYPSKQHCGYNKMSNQKLTKTIMSPLTTMPPKKLMNAPQIITIRPNSPHQANMKANEKLPMNTMASNNNVTMQLSALKNNFTNKITAPLMNAPKSVNVVAQPKAEPKIVDKVKETAAGYRSDEISLDDVHPYITCFLCRGYLIEATTIVECLHTFCHSCLMMHLSKEASLSCPQCKMIINKSKTNIK